MDEQSGGLTGTVNNLLTWGMGKVDKGFEFFGLYTSKYSKVILILVGLWIGSKLLKVKLNIGGGGKH